MKIAFTGDNHVQINGNHDQLLRMHAEAEQASVFLCGGDMGEGLRPDFGGTSPEYDTLLATHSDTMYVMGNHDLYNPNKLTPDNALAVHQTLLYPASAHSLETTWEETETVLIRDDHAFIGTVGFPDFLHPELPHERNWYVDARNYRTIDPSWIDLRDWSAYTDAVNTAFSIRLTKASERASNIVIVTHYPCLQQHLRGVARDSAWPYFYNWQLGMAILSTAAKYHAKRFWVLAAHSHEFCLGKWGAAADNVLAYGLHTDYHRQSVMVFDTAHDIDVLSEVETKHAC
jgi:hypothetical protein